MEASQRQALPLPFPVQFALPRLFKVFLNMKLNKGSWFSPRLRLCHSFPNPQKIDQVEILCFLVLPVPLLYLYDISHIL
jgi:hypothetical protein